MYYTIGQYDALAKLGFTIPSLGANAKPLAQAAEAVPSLMTGAKAQFKRVSNAAQVGYNNLSGTPGHNFWAGERAMTP
jgi:hypothetical protein